METLWSPGEDGARDNLNNFLDSAIDGYGENRNRPDFRSTSRLSPHLRFGEISPRQIWQTTRMAAEAGNSAGKPYDFDKFLAEVGWREFSYICSTSFRNSPAPISSRVSMPFRGSTTRKA